MYVNIECINLNDVAKLMSQLPELSEMLRKSFLSLMLLCHRSHLSNLSWDQELLSGSLCYDVVKRRWFWDAGFGRRLSVQSCTVLTSPDVLYSCTHCWLNVRRHEWCRPANLLSAVISWFTQCGKTWMTTASASFVCCRTHGWLNVGRLGSRRPNHKCSWHVWNLPHCGKKCYRPCQDFDHSENVKFVRQNRFIVSLFVALTTSSIYVLCPFAARYFSALASSSGLWP